MGGETPSIAVHIETLRQEMVTGFDKVEKAIDGLSGRVRAIEIENARKNGFISNAQETIKELCRVVDERYTEFQQLSTKVALLDQSGEMVARTQEEVREDWRGFGLDLLKFVVTALIGFVIARAFS